MTEATPSGATKRKPEWVFYDGTCGLCHRAVRFLVRRDRDGTLFRFAPLQGGTFRQEIPEPQRTDLPHSVVVKTSNGGVLTRSEATTYLARRLDRPWRWLGGLMGLVPPWVLDLGYDGVAAVRNRLFRAPADLCPNLPPALRSRFHD
jgi:predicted DCC family thiol-disulfide oxidoreductase YuxK